MSTSTMPGFTADGSLYKTSGRYRTGLLGPGTQGLGAIRPAAIDEGEVIVIVDNWPPDPWQPPDWSGHGGGAPVPQGPSGGGSGSGSGGGGPKPPPKCRNAVGRVEEEGVNMRKECVGKKRGPCCEDQAQKCRDACPPGPGRGAETCNRDCSDSRRVCVDAKGEVCSLP